MAAIGVALIAGGALFIEQGNTGGGAIMIMLGLAVILMAKYVEE